jgi:hypothetical protein
MVRDDCVQVSNHVTHCKWNDCSEPHQLGRGAGARASAGGGGRAAAAATRPPEQPRVLLARTFNGVCFSPELHALVDFWE